MRKRLASKFAQAVEPLTCFWEVSGLDLEQYYVDVDFPYFLSVPRTRCRMKPKLGHDNLHILFIALLFVIHIQDEPETPDGL
jgi:hypothetical protein